MSNPFDDPASTNPFEETPPAQAFKPSEVFGDAYHEISEPAAPPVPSRELKPVVAVSGSPVPAGPTAIAPAAPEAAPAPAPRLEFQDMSAPGALAPTPLAAQAAPAAPPPPPASSGGAAIVAPDVNFESVQRPEEGGAALTGEGAGQPAKRSCTQFWKPSFYQPYFNVDVVDVLKRMLAGLWPFGRNFFEVVHPTADIYGPFWITTTLLFLLAAVSNFASYIDYWRHGASASWNYDFMRVAVAAGVLYLYISIVPFVLWLVQKFALDLTLSLVDLWCLYGYSLTVYLIVSLPCIAPINWLRWLLVAFAGLISTFSLVFSLWRPIVKSTVWLRGLITVIIAGALHAGLALTFKLYFFDYLEFASGVPV